MYWLDIIAAFALTIGAVVGARKGMWRLFAGNGALSLALLAGGIFSSPLATFFREIGVAAPGDKILGFFLPFAVVSVYGRYMLGLWLSKKFGSKFEVNRTWGAFAGIIWMVFCFGFVMRAVGVENKHTRANPVIADAAGPFSRWLSNYGGEIGARIYLNSPEATEKEKEQLQKALDISRPHAIASTIDNQTRDVLKTNRAIPLRLDPMRKEDE